MSEIALPYRRTYSRALVILALAAVPIFAVLPEATTGLLFSLRAFVCVFGIAVSALWCPVLVYAGVRTRCPIDAIVGCVGTLALLYWVPHILLG